MEQLQSPFRDTGVFEVSDGKCWALKAADCIDCGNCPGICPENALAVAVGWGG
ncbi:hypothetical protein BMS3Abin09_00749 [bacterium BMS3Abin09]|nr:hypothetical protein BMS3Abin09_00749 [bacterium BMS3Abin09]